MNNPGLEDAIADTGAVAQDTLEPKLDPSAQQQDDAHHSRHRFARAHSITDADGMQWWFMSTASPLIAGTFGPLANLMSVCALVQTWRVKIPPGDNETQGERISDPAWLIAVNVVSLVLAIFANLVLLLNFSHRIPYRFAQPITVVGWYISSLLLIGIVAAAAAELRLNPLSEHAFSQSFYYAIISAALYAIISSLLLANMAGAYVFRAYPPSFTTLTIPQRTLMLQTISYTIYLGVGALVFSHVEQWNYVDGVYWANYTLLTIGLGSDFPLHTTLARALLMPYAVGGITMLGLVIGSIRSLVLDRGKKRVRRQALEKQRRKAIKRADSAPSHSWRKTEFEKMREVQDKADASRKYWSLVLSLSAFLILWLGGATVFTFSEKKQSWTYFEALYFSYTSLLTIGYGDFFPQSNSGRPFFVIWSLIAVPTMTILISNMGDTVVDWVREGTLWLGERTILPETKLRPHGLRATLCSGPRILQRKEKQKSPKDPWASTDPNVHNEDSTRALSRDVERVSGVLEKAETNRTHAEGEDDVPDEGDDASVVTSSNGRPETRKHVLAARVAREIKRLAVDIGASPPKRYHWDQWARWMRLVGDGSGGGGTGPDKDGGEWSWLGEGGPLLGGSTETEWILGRLCERLEEVIMMHEQEEEEQQREKESGGEGRKP